LLYSAFAAVATARFLCRGHFSATEPLYTNRENGIMQLRCNLTASRPV